MMIEVGQFQVHCRATVTETDELHCITQAMSLLMSLQRKLLETQDITYDKKDQHTKKT